MANDPNDPLKNIEEGKGQRDIGVLIARMFEGALEESGSMVIAFWGTAAYFYGTWKDPPPPEDER